MLIDRRLLAIALPHILGPSIETSLGQTDDPDTDPDTDSEEEATERTGLLGRSKASPVVQTLDRLAANTELVAGVLGLLIGVVKPVQRILIGTSESATGGWASVGGGLMLLAAAYATVEILGVGASIRAGEKK